jgi:hypothetical protein
LSRTSAALVGGNIKWKVTQAVKVPRIWETPFYAVDLY